MPSTETPLILRMTKQLYWAERFFLVALFIGIVIKLLNAGGISVVTISMAGLGIVFFLYAYRPLEIDRREDEKFGFNELLAFTILPKVTWISSSISVIGILFYLLDLGNEGYKQMLMIGGSCLLLAITLLGFLFISGVKHLNSLVPLLYRAVPLLLIDLYIFLKL